MWRTQQYKLILQFNRKESASEYEMSDIIGGEFYDLTEDPKEWNNLYDHKEVLNKQNEMKSQLLLHLKKLKRTKLL